MRLKSLLLLIFLLIPEIVPAYYVYHPCCLHSGGWWADIDYMLIWRKKRFYPALVTTNPVDVPELGFPGTSVLFGDKRLGGKPKSGFKIDVGAWLNPCVALGTGYLAVANEKINFHAAGDQNGNPILGNPFFDTFAGLPSVELISVPGVAINGSVDIDTSNRIWDYDLYLRYRFWKTPCYKLDFLFGFDFNGVTDNFKMGSQTTFLENMATFRIEDQFKCKNNFWGGLVGAVTEWRGKNWGLMLCGKAGIGSMRKKIEVQGNTTTISEVDGTTTTFPVGLLTLPSNIGNHKHSTFEVVSQIHANAQWRICGHLWINIGYMYMFWPSLVLAGEQINLNINPNQPPSIALGVPAPQPPHKDTNFWIQGLTAGFYIFY